MSGKYQKLVRKFRLGVRFSWDGGRSGEDVALVRVPAAVNPTKVTIMAASLTISGVGLGVASGINMGRRPHPARVVPRANRFNGFTKVEGSSDRGLIVVRVPV